MRSKLLSFLLMGCCSIGAFLFNYLFLENIIIPDPCAYHGEDTTWLFDIFYSTPSFNGDHPLPSIINYCVTLFVGIAIGRQVAKYLNRKLTKEYSQQFLKH